MTEWENFKNQKLDGMFQCGMYNCSQWSRSKGLNSHNHQKIAINMEQKSAQSSNTVEVMKSLIDLIIITIGKHISNQ